MKKTKTQRLWCLLLALIINIGAFNASAVTITAKATTTTWTEPCVWYWGGGSEQNIANPMQYVSEDGTYSWWTFELPDAATGFLFKNISNGSDWTLQSANVTPPVEKTCYKLSSTNKSAAGIIDCPIVTEPTITVLSYTPDPIIIGNEITFTAATDNFTGDPTIVYSVKFEDGEYAELTDNLYTPDAVGNYTVKAVATFEAETALLEKSFAVLPEPTPITLKLDPSTTDWETVNLYAWDADGNPINGGWPGNATELDADGWYSATVNITGAINLIWNNGTEQTVDVIGVEDSQCHALADLVDTKYDVTLVDCPAPSGPVVTEITYTPDPIIIGNEITFTAATANFSGDPTIVYSVKFEDGEYVELTDNLYTPDAVGNYTVKAVATFEEETALLEQTFTASEPVTTITIRAKVTAEWTEPCVWYWGGGDNPNQANPMTIDEIVEGGTWYTYELPSNIEGFLFKNIADGETWLLQSLNVDPVTEPTCYQLASTTNSEATIIDCSNPDAPVVLSISINPSPVIIGNEITFTAATDNFTGDPTIVYSVKFEDGEYAELTDNLYTPDAVGNYTVKAVATFEAETAEKEITFEAIDACAPKNWSLIGTAVGNWETDIDFVYNEEESDISTCTNVYDINNISILVGSFKIRQDHSWGGTNLGYPDVTISGDAGNITDGGIPDNNFQAAQETTYSKITLKSVVNQETGIETYELIFNIATEIDANKDNANANVYVKGMNIYSDIPTKVINQIGKVVGNGTCVTVDAKGLYIVIQGNNYIKVLVK